MYNQGILLVFIIIIVVMFLIYFTVFNKKGLKKSIDLSNSSNNLKEESNNLKEKNEEIKMNDFHNNSIEDCIHINNTYYNKTMMQYFEWYCSNDGLFWKKIKEEAKELKNIGITALWLPPAYKGVNGIDDVGYGVYDLYDLGEFEQKGSIRTKYGLKDEYLEAINVAHENGIEVYADIVLNHKGGGESSEIISAVPVDSNNRNNPTGEKREIEAYTVFNFPNRGNKYSSYKWSAEDFTGVDFDGITNEKRIFKFDKKDWAQEVDNENGNYDYLMFNDIDMNNRNVVEELKNWGRWYLEETNIDGVRLDAIKHIKFDFFKEWLDDLRKEKQVFAIGEYWSGDINKLNYYIDKSGNSMSLFDVPLHYNFYKASNSNGLFDMRNIEDNTLLKSNPEKAVTFVDNHDTQIGQSLESWIEPWFKLLAYTFILTRKDGYPCIFYGDYYGISENNFAGFKDEINLILHARKYYSYGIQHDYIDNEDVIGWTREGEFSHKDSGLATLITNASGGNKIMYVGKNHIGEVWRDITGNVNKEVIIDENGNGDFFVNERSYTIWTKKI